MFVSVEVQRCGKLHPRVASLWIVEKTDVRQLIFVDGESYAGSQGVRLIIGANTNVDGDHIAVQAVDCSERPILRRSAVKQVEWKLQRVL